MAKMRGMESEAYLILADANAAAAVTTSMRRFGACSCNDLL